MSWAEVKNLKDYIDSKVKVSTDYVGVSKIFVRSLSDYGGKSVTIYRNGTAHKTANVGSDGFTEFTVTPNAKFYAVLTNGSDKYTSDTIYVGAGECVELLCGYTPVGSTVTPTDSAATLIACAGGGYNYTTVAQIIADSACLTKIAASNNAIDYLFRLDSGTLFNGITENATAFAKIATNPYAVKKICASEAWSRSANSSSAVQSIWNYVLGRFKTAAGLTNITTVDGTGIVSSSTHNNANYALKYLVDGDDAASTPSTNPHWIPANNSGMSYLTLSFPSAVCVKKLEWQQGAEHQGSANVVVSVSNDGSRWTSIVTGTHIANNRSIMDMVKNTIYARYLRITRNNMSGYCSIGELMVYGCKE